MGSPEKMIGFIKSLSNTNRLRLIGLLSKAPLSRLDLSTSLGMPPSELAHHLDQLAAAGVIQLQGDLVSLDEEAIEVFRIQQLHRPREFFSPPDHLSADDAAIIRKLAAPDGSLKRLPGHLKQWMAVLRYILPEFSLGSSYTEKQVNSLLMRFHADTAALRRYLVDTGMLRRERDGSRYWREVQHD